MWRGEGVPPLRRESILLSHLRETEVARGRDARETQGPEALATLSRGECPSWNSAPGRLE